MDRFLSVVLSIRGALYLPFFWTESAIQYYMGKLAVFFKTKILLRGFWVITTSLPESILGDKFARIQYG